MATGMILILQLGKLRLSYFTEVRSFAWGFMTCDFLPFWASASSENPGLNISLQGDSPGQSSGSLEPGVGGSVGT